MISNGEFNPLPQTRQQRQVEARIKELADKTAKKLGLSRRRFLRTGSGMAAAFLAMNDVYGRIFDVSAAEAAEPAAAAERAQQLANQYIVDVQTHFVHDDFKAEFIMGIVNYAAELQPGDDERPRRADPQCLKIRQLSETHLARQRHQGRTSQRRALRRPGQLVPEQR